MRTLVLACPSYGQPSRPCSLRPKQRISEVELEKARVAIELHPEKNVRGLITTENNGNDQTCRIRNRSARCSLIVPVPLVSTFNAEGQNARVRITLRQS